jgi:hypothetical protein
MPTPALFKTKEVKIDTLGEYLSQVRAQLNLDIKTVSILTQIKSSYLEKLEAADYASLPADVYIRGFLKSLAVFYHLKEQVLIDQYEKERGVEALAPMIKTEQSKISLTPRKLIVGFSVLIALAAVIYIFIQIRSVLAPPYLSITEPLSDQTVSSDSIVISGKGEVGASIFINSQPVLTGSNGEFTENLLLSPGLNVVEISEKNKFNKTSSITRQITSQPMQDKPVAIQAVNLIVNIGPKSAWVYLEADGIVVSQGTMLAGSSKSISAKQEIILTSADAGSTSVIYNGKDLGKLGREGEVIRNVQFSSQ